MDFLGCGSWAPEHNLSSFAGLVALQHVGSSRSRDQTCFPCTGRWILNHWTTRKAPVDSLGNQKGGELVRAEEWRRLLGADGDSE